MTDIPSTTAEISAQWLTTTLRSSGWIDSQSVTDCRVERIGAEFGFASQVARIELTYDSTVENLPKTMIAKLAVTNDDQGRNETLCEKNRREADFYSKIGPDAGIRIPRCYFVAHAETPERCVILLEDLGAGRFGDAGKGCSLNDAGRVIDTLALLHGQWWNDPRLNKYDWLPRFGNLAARMEQFPQRRVKFLERYGDLLPNRVKDFTLRIGSQQTAMLERVGGPPETLLHVDTHLDNIAFLENGDEIEAVLFDWQGTSKGLCVVDLALFLSGALMEQTRIDEQGLLERYFQGLVAAGVDDYPANQFREDYRIAMLRWWIGTIGGLGSPYAETWSGRQADLARQSVERWCTTIAGLRLWNLC